MARVQRANVILQVDDRDISHYLNLGYNLIDDHGTVLKEAIPTNLGVLQAKYLEHLSRIAELEDTVAKLTAQLSESQTTKKSSRKSKDSE